MLALANPKLVSYHQDYDPIHYFIGTYMKDVEPNLIDDKTYVIDQITSNKEPSYKIKNIFNTSNYLIASCFKIPPWIPPVESGDIIIAFVQFINEYSNVSMGCYLQCNETNRQLIMSCKRTNICLHLWIDSSCDSCWAPKKLKYTKTFETLYIEESKILRVKEVIKNFGQKFDFYQKQGIPYKLSFLLQGRPGTGKTSFIKASPMRLDLMCAS